MSQTPNRFSLLLQPAPRKVPFRTACLAFGGPVGTFGAVLFAFGMVFCILFLGRDFRPFEDWRLNAQSAIATGIVTTAERTNASENRVQIYRYQFTFDLPSHNQRVSGRCYGRGTQWSAGDRTMVEYHPGDPRVARIRGNRRSIWPPLALVVLVFPSIGTAALIVGLVQGVSRIRLLRSGEIASATRIVTEMTNVSVNDVNVLKHCYEFIDHLGRSRRGVSRALPSPFIGDERAEPVLFLPSNPAHSMLLDALPCGNPLEIDATGQWAIRGGWGRVFGRVVAYGLAVLTLLWGAALLVSNSDRDATPAAIERSVPLRFGE